MACIDEMQQLWTRMPLAIRAPEIQSVAIAI
jgi:hypothetical protein